MMTARENMRKEERLIHRGRRTKEETHNACATKEMRKTHMERKCTPKSQCLNTGKPVAAPVPAPMRADTNRRGDTAVSQDSQCTDSNRPMFRRKPSRARDFSDTTMLRTRRATTAPPQMTNAPPASSMTAEAASSGGRRRGEEEGRGMREGGANPVNTTQRGHTTRAREYTGARPAQVPPSPRTWQLVALEVFECAHSDRHRGRRVLGIVRGDDRSIHSRLQAQEHAAEVHIVHHWVVARVGVVVQATAIHLRGGRGLAHCGTQETGTRTHSS